MPPATRVKRPREDGEVLSSSFKLPRLSAPSPVKADAPSSPKRRRPASTAEVDVAPDGVLPTPAASISTVEASTSDGSSSTLASLLDLSAILTSSTPSPAARFCAIAHALLHDYHLCVSSSADSDSATITRFELLEVEFYLRAPGHLDPFAHGTDEQRVPGRWYFHRAPRRSADASRSATGTGWRGGTRKGVDLTFGGPSSPSSASDEEEGVRGGILIRALLPAVGRAAIVGPSLVVDALLAATRAASIKELVIGRWAGDTAALSSRPGAMWFEPRAAPPDTRDEVFCGPRIGLELSHPGTSASGDDPRVRFVGAHLRFFRRPALLTRVGRAHTVLALLPSPVPATLSERIVEEIAEKTGLGVGAVRKLLDAYMLGRKEGAERGAGALERWVGPKGKGVGAKMDIYARMVGCIVGASVTGE